MLLGDEGEKVAVRLEGGHSAQHNLKYEDTVPATPLLLKTVEMQLPKSPVLKCPCNPYL